MNNKGIIPLDADTIRAKIHFIRGQHKKYLPFAFTEQGVSMNHDQDFRIIVENCCCLCK